MKSSRRFWIDSRVQAIRFTLDGTYGVRVCRIGPEITLAVAIVGLITGCGSPEMAPIPTKTLAEFTCRTSSEGLEVAVDAWTDSSRVKRHFGIDLLSRQIVPFEVAFANIAAEGGYLLQPQAAVVLDDKGLEEIRAAPGGITPSYLDPRVVPAIDFLVSHALAIGVVLVTEEAYRDEQDVRRQMNSVRFVDRPLYRSDSNRGFLYLQFGDMAALPNIAAVMFHVKNVRTRQETILIVPLTGK